MLWLAGIADGLDLCVCRVCVDGWVLSSWLSFHILVNAEATFFADSLRATRSRLTSAAAPPHFTLQAGVARLLKLNRGSASSKVSGVQPGVE